VFVTVEVNDESGDSDEYAEDDDDKSIELCVRLVSSKLLETLDLTCLVAETCDMSTMLL